MILDIENLQNAAVQDSNYTDTGLTNARYNGSVASPTFSPSGSDLFNSEKADYPIIRLTSVEGVIFETGFSDIDIRELINNPIDQLKLRNLFIATFSREKINQGLRQIEPDRLRIELELPLSGSKAPAVQTFIFEEVEGKLKRVPTKKILFVQQSKIGITDSVGKLLGTTSGGITPLSPPINATFTRVFITSFSTTTPSFACSIQSTSIEKFMDPIITSLDPISLIGQTIFDNSSLVTGSEEFNGTDSYYGISFFSNQLPTTSILVNISGSILEAQDCSEFDVGDFGGEQFL